MPVERDSETSEMANPVVRIYPMLLPVATLASAGERGSPQDRSETQPGSTRLQSRDAQTLEKGVESHGEGER